MNRSSGIGPTSFGMVLVVVGAILRFATSVQTSGFNIHKVGDIFLLVGILMVILSLVVIAMGSRRRVRNLGTEQRPPARSRARSTTSAGKLSRLAKCTRSDSADMPLAGRVLARATRAR